MPLDIVRKKRVWNIPLIAVVTAMIGVLGVAGLIANYNLIITLQQHIVTTDMPATLNASPGDNFTFSWNIYNRNLPPNDNNFTVLVLSNASADQLKINIKDNSGNILASSTSGSAQTGNLLVNASSWLYNASNGTIEFQFNITAPAGIYSLNLTVEPGTWNWRI